MRTASRRFRIALPFCLGALLAPAIASARPSRRAGSSPPANLTVRIDDRAGLSPAGVARAEAIAEHLLGKVQIEPRWLDGRPFREETGSCLAPGSEDVLVLITPRPPAEGGSNPGAAGLAVFSAVDRRGSHIFIFRERLTAATASGLVDAPVILGHLLAHEIGHILMGPGSHSIGGLMAPRWSRADLRRMARGSLAFTSAEGERMRRGLHTVTARVDETGDELTARGCVRRPGSDSVDVS